MTISGWCQCFEIKMQFSISPPCFEQENNFNLTDITRGKI